MKAASFAALLTSCGLAVAAPRSSHGAKSLFRRWEYDVCLNDCSLAGVPVPDTDTFQLLLEDNWSEQCPPIYIGDWSAPTAVSRVCLEFAGPYLTFNFSPFPGYTTKSASVAWQVIGNGSPDIMTAPTSQCEPAGTDGTFTCKLPFADILGVSSTEIIDLLNGMCPNGDREALSFYLAFWGEVESQGPDGETVPFHNQYPCTKRDCHRNCKSWNNSYPYIEVGYRCTKCNVNPCTTW